MEKELYFEVSAEGGVSRIYKISKQDGTIYFTDNHSEMVADYDEDNDVVFTKTKYDSIEAFWNEFIKLKYWYRLYALNIHDEIKPLIKNSIEQKQLELNSLNEKSAYLISDSWFECLGMINENYLNN